MFSANWGQVWNSILERQEALATGAEPTERERREAEDRKACGDEWDRLRALLLPCPKCGSLDLLFKTARMLEMAHVWCRGCGYGTPQDQDCSLIVNTEGMDARLAAVDAWNAKPR